MVPVLEAVPNFSEGRDPSFLEAVTDAARRSGVDVLDASSDAEHHRSVVTWVGDPVAVERAAVAVAEVAMARIDLRHHRGVHPRVGALDVLPVVPLVGLTMHDAVRSARRIGAALADLGLPVYLYGAASTPPGRTLAELRRGGFEGLLGAPSDAPEPDFPAGAARVHATAGAACVGARPVLLAWNVLVEGVSRAALGGLAARLRERGGGLPGLRTLALELEESGVLQLSMNLEDVEARDPMLVFDAIEAGVQALGGRIAGTEVIGMIPEALVLGAATRRLNLLDSNSARFLPARLTEHLAARTGRDAGVVRSWIDASGADVPPDVRDALERLTGQLYSPGDQR